MSRSRRFLRDLCIHAEALGWVGNHTGSGHIRWTHPEVPGAIVTACTPRKDVLGIEKARFTRTLANARTARGEDQRRVEK